MKRNLLSGLLVLAGAVAAQHLSAGLDSVYRCYAVGDYSTAKNLLEQLDLRTKTPADRFLVKLEIGDFLLDKRQDYAAAESVYNLLLAEFPKEKRRPDVLYRLALAQEQQEKFLDAARNYEQVATRYMKTTYGEDALDAIERCFRKNYQDRVAYVDGFPITRIELDDRISRNPAMYEPFEKKQELLNEMIDTRLLYKGALAAGVMNDPKFATDVAQMRNRVVFQEWYRREIELKAEPTNKAVQAQYRKDRASRYTTPEKVHAYQIVVAEKTLADSLRRALLADTTLSWDSVARQYSTAPDKEKGGDMGLFARGTQPRPIENVAFQLRPGQLSQPIKTDQGYVLMKVTERKPRVIRPLSEVENQIKVQLRQENVNRLYEAKTAELRRRANVVTDTNAIAQNKDTLALVYGSVITPAELTARIDQIPPFFRGQFETPEGKQRILDQLILEKLLLYEVERSKTWLWNKVVDRVLEQRTQMAIDRYRTMMTTEKVRIDSARVKADYKANINEHKVPAQVHLREIVARSRNRAEQLRTWAKAERLPAMLEGRAVLVLDQDSAARLKEALAATNNTDSIVALFGLAGTPALAGTPTVRAGAKEVPNITRPWRAAGPYRNVSGYGLAFTDLSAEDQLFTPILKEPRTPQELAQVLGEELKIDSTGAPILDSAKLGAYVALEGQLPSDFVKGLFRLETGQVTERELAHGWLIVKVTKKDTAQKATFADIARRFSIAGSRWSGGDMNWLSRDDEAHDKKVVNAGFELSAGSISPVMKLNDTTFVFIKVEEKKKAYTRPLEEVWAKIEGKLRRADEKQAYDALLADLRARARIEVLMKESDFIFETEPAEETPSGGESQPGGGK
ncbi:MAG: peptidyl-prolyl cis-trans isomerase [candidate division WOR-3 bacterium]